MEVVEVSNTMDANTLETGYDSIDGNKEEDVSNDVNDEQDQLLGEELGKDLDIKVFANDEEYNEFLNRDTRPTDERHRVDKMEESAVRHERDNRAAIE
jgi:hypothetical protein